LASKMSVRYPSRPPVLGQSIDMVFVWNPKTPKRPHAECSEEPEVVQRKQLQIDYTWYINNHIQNAVVDLMALSYTEHAQCPQTQLGLAMDLFGRAKAAALVHRTPKRGRIETFFSASKRAHILDKDNNKTSIL
jgi:hypothetical protein